MMRKIVGLLRFISLASLGLLFNGIAAYLIFNPNPESLALSWLAVAVCVAAIRLMLMWFLYRTQLQDL